MLNQNKTVNIVVGGIAIASLALFAYTVTRPTKTSKKRKRRSSSKIKSKKYTKKFVKKPIDVHLVMETLEGFNAHVAGDKKNSSAHLKFGSRLIKINDRRVDGATYQEIMDILSKMKTPITLQFREMDELAGQWQEAEQLKQAANADFKQGETESAVSKVSKAISLHVTNKVYYSNRILMLLKQKEYRAALSDCQTIRELDPNSKYIKGHYLRGLTLLHLEKYKNAASAFQTVVKLQPDFKKAKDRLAECLTKLKVTDTIELERKSSEQQELADTLIKKRKSIDDDDEDKKQDESVDVVQEEVAKPEPEPETEPEARPPVVNAAPDLSEPAKQEAQPAAKEEEAPNDPQPPVEEAPKDPQSPVQEEAPKDQQEPEEQPQVEEVAPKDAQLSVEEDVPEQQAEPQIESNVNAAVVPEEGNAAPST